MLSGAYSRQSVSPGPTLFEPKNKRNNLAAIAFEPRKLGPKDEGFRLSDSCIQARKPHYLDFGPPLTLNP